MSKGRVLMVSDLHANTRLPMARVDSGGISSDRLRDVVSILDQMGEYARENDVRNVLILGDLFDVQRPDGATIVAVSRALHSLASDGIVVRILPGNHDAVDREGQLYNLDLYNELNLPNIIVFGHETWEITQGLRVHACPWLPEQRARRRIRKRAADCDNQGRDVILLHQTMSGAIGDTGYVSDDGLDAAAVDGFAMAFSGHYHKPQFHDWGMYLGSPLHLRFSEESVTERGFWDVDLAAKKIKPRLVQTTYPVFASDTVKLDETDVLDDLMDIEESAAGCSYLRLILKGHPAAIERARATVDKWRAQLDKYGLRAIKTDERPQREGRVRLELTKPTFDLAEAMGAYVKLSKPAGQSESELMDIGSRLLSEAAAVKP